MAGVENPVISQTIDGKTFLPLLANNNTRESDRALYWHYPNKWGAEGPGIGTTSTIRKGDWKMIYWYKDQKKEIYNLREDIGESNDLSDEFPEKMIELSKNLGNFLRETQAQRPVIKKTGKPVPWPDEQ